MKRWKIPLLLASGAVLTALTLVFPTVGILEWFTMIPLIIGCYLLCNGGAGLGRCYRWGFFAVYVYYFVLYHWFVRLYPLDFVDMSNGASLVVVLAGWLGLSLLQAIPGGLIFLFFRLIGKTGIFDRAPLLRPFAFAALWTLFEWSSTIGWTGVPWGRLCLGLVKWLPMLESAELFGCYFVSFLIVAVNALIAEAILYQPRAAVCVTVAMGMLLSDLLYGTFRNRLAGKEETTVTVAVIQGNIDSHEKWDDNSEEKMKTVYGDLTRRAAAEGAQLIVWPETALPYVLNYRGDLQYDLSELAKECNASLLVGALYDDEKGREYNSLFFITPDGKFSDERYDKRHLVPFGEYVPMRDVIMALIPPLADLSALGDDLTPGADTGLIGTAWGEVGSLVCFDSIYETLTVESCREGAGLMVVSSNDSWFYDSAAVYQHEAQSQLRAIESGRWVVRAANTGISTVISPRGEITAWLDPLTEGYAVANVSFRTQNTLYTRIGNLFVALCAAFCAALPIAECAARTRKKVHPE